MFIHLVGTPQININQPARDLINPGFNDRHNRFASSWHPSVASFLPLSYGRMISRDDSWCPVITNLTRKLIDSHFPKQPIFFLSMCTHSQRSQIGNVRQKKSTLCFSKASNTMGKWSEGNNSSANEKARWKMDPNGFPNRRKPLVTLWEPTEGPMVLSPKVGKIPKFSENYFASGKFDQYNLIVLCHKPNSTLYLCWSGCSLSIINSKSLIGNGMVGEPKLKKTSGTVGETKLKKTSETKQNKTKQENIKR